MVLTITLLAGALGIASICFYIANLLALVHWRRQKLPVHPFAPPVSILKPLKGCDEGMYEAFRSHCLQEYQEYEIIFGVNSLDDPAAPFVERLRREFPEREISLIVCTEIYGVNRKASNLVHLVRAAKHRYLVINDSDIKVGPGYLASLMRWFSEAQIGMLTCLYRPGTAPGLWSKLEALGIVADFMPGALTARMLERKVRFGLGSTMAIDHLALERIGGMEVVADYLADDYELATRIGDAGYEVLVPDVVVETSLPRYSFREFWQHQLRWGRTVRASRLGGYIGLVITFGTFWAIVTVTAAKAAPWSVVLLALILVIRTLPAVSCARLLGDRDIVSSFWLLPLRDLISPVVWLLSLFGDEIVWRGERFELRTGRLRQK